jgi:threonine synthase
VVCVVSHFTHPECTLCGRMLDADSVADLCPADGKPLLARYGLEAARELLSPDELEERPPTLWRYREVLPVRRPKHELCLGEGFSPLLQARRLGERYGHDALFIKEGSFNPTGSIRALGLCATRPRRLSAKTTTETAGLRSP